MSSLTDKGVMVQEFKHFSKMCYEILGEMTCNTGKTYPRIKLLEAFGQSLPRANFTLCGLEAGCRYPSRLYSP